MSQPGTASVHPLARLNSAAEQLWPVLNTLWSEHALAPTHGLAHGEPVGDLGVEVRATIDSTNTELMRRARTGQAAQTAPVLLVAAEQTAGRGRMGKAWVSQPGDSLTFSLGLPLRPAQWAGLSLAVGVALAEALAGLLPVAQRAALQLKWPNDLWLHGAKLAGILVETAHTAQGPYVVVGMGINLAPPPAHRIATPTPTATPTATTAWPGVPPTGLLARWPPSAGLAPDAAAVLVAVAPAVLQALLAFEWLGFSAFAQRFACRDALQGQALVLSDGLHGTGCGVDDSGALLVLTEHGMRAVSSNEVSVRPTPRAHPNVQAQAPLGGSPPC